MVEPHQVELAQLGQGGLQRGLPRRVPGVGVQHIQPPQDLEPGVFAFGNSIAIGPSHVGFGAHFSNSGTAFVYETTAGGLVPAAVILGQPFLGEQMFFDDTTLLISSPAEALVHLYEPAL